MERLRRNRLIKSLESLERLQRDRVNEAQQALAICNAAVTKIIEEISKLEDKYKFEKSAIISMTLDEQLNFAYYAENHIKQKSKLQNDLEEHMVQLEKMRENLAQKFHEQKIVQKALGRNYEEKNLEENTTEMKVMDEIASRNHTASHTV